MHCHASLRTAPRCQPASQPAQLGTEIKLQHKVDEANALGEAPFRWPDTPLLSSLGERASQQPACMYSGHAAGHPASLPASNGCRRLQRMAAKRAGQDDEDDDDDDDCE